MNPAWADTLTMLRKIARSFAQAGLRHLSAQCYRHAGGPDRPVFLDPKETVPELLRIDENYDAIREELLPILPRTAELPHYHEIDARQERISNADERSWRVFFVYVAGQEDRLEATKQCPRTAEVLRGIPGIINAFFSILEAGKSVPAHEGPSFHYLRYHTAFKVPATNPPTMRVKDRFYTWTEGESLLFDDSWEHEVMNSSDDIRVVLIVDVLRPMPWRLRLLQRVVRRLFRLATTEATRRAFHERAALPAVN